MALYLKEADVRGLITMPRAIELVEEAFRAHGRRQAINRPRSRLILPGFVLHQMSGAVPAQGVVGQKAYTATRQGVRFLVTLWSAETGQVLAFIEADWLGQVRTGAASGVATKYLARPEARTVGIIGTGGQARTQLLAICAVRPIASIRAYSRTAERRERFAHEMSESLGVPVEPVDRPEQAVGDAEVVVTATTSKSPVLAGAWLAPGTHVNAMGSNWANRRELDDEAVRRSHLIAADDLEDARIECGDLVGAVEAGVTTWAQVVELGAIVAGTSPGRQRAEQITLFESQGLAIEDVAVGAWIYEQARARGLGEELPLFA